MRKRLASCALAAAAAALMLLLAPAAAIAVPIELVVNGEFEPPPVGFFIGSDASVPGWASSTGQMEIFTQGFAGSPPLGADGLGTGQHCEITVNPGTQSIFQSFVIPPEQVFADFYFEMWPRFGDAVPYSVVGTLSGTIASGSLAGPGNVWTPFLATGLSVVPGETVTLTFTGGPGGADEHVDAVSFQVHSPEPATLTLLALGGLGLLRRRAHSRKG
jgi:MYXO-CTERM domain-containing protein